MPTTAAIAIRDGVPAKPAAQVTWTLDVGNTRVKAGVFRGDQLVAVRPTEDPDKVWVKTLLADGVPERIEAASVNAETLGRLLSLLAWAGLPAPRVWRSDGGLFATGLLTHDLATPQTTGIDRLLAAVGGRRRAPTRAVLVVDCGTAITLSWTTSAGCFRGGAILPGLRAMSGLLSEAAPALPRVHVEQPPPLPGRSTRDAIAAGIYWTAVGGIERLLTELLCGAGEPTIVFGTGGDFPLLADALRLTVTAVPHLVLEGLFEVARAVPAEAPPTP